MGRVQGPTAIATGRPLVSGSESPVAGPTRPEPTDPLTRRNLHVDPGPRRAGRQPAGRPPRAGVRALDRRLPPSAQGRADRRDPRPPGRRGRVRGGGRRRAIRLRGGRGRARAAEEGEVEPSAAEEADGRADREPPRKADGRATEPPTEERAGARRRRGRRGGRGRGSARDEDAGAADEEEEDQLTPAAEESEEADEPVERGGRGGRGGRASRAGGRDRRGRGRAPGQRLGLPARQSTRALRGRRVRLGGAGQALRARAGRPDRRSAPAAAALRAVRLADPDRHDQRPAGRGGGRQHAGSRTSRPRSRPSASGSGPTTRRSRRSNG